MLPRLLATGPMGRAVWALYGFLPLVWIPAGVGAFYALRGTHEGSMRIGMMLALVAAIAMMLELCVGPVSTGCSPRLTPKASQRSGVR